MALDTRGNTEAERRTAQGPSYGQMDLRSRAHSLTTTSTVLEFTSGRTAAATLANGRITECMAGVFSLGATAELTMGNIATTLRMAMASSDGQMDGNTRASGMKESSMALELIPPLEVRSRQANGTKEGGRGGFPIRRSLPVLRHRHCVHSLRKC